METVFATISAKAENNEVNEETQPDDTAINESVVTVPSDTNDSCVSEDTGDVDNTAADYIRIFNIEICVNDQKVEPKARVSVSISLLDAPEEKSSDLRVVHFGTESIEMIKTENDIGEKPGEIKLDFTTDSFSVYSIVSTIPSDAYSLDMLIDGKSFADCQ